MMSWKLRGFILAICLCFSASGALATDAIVKRRATLRSDPSTQRPPILTLKPQEDVELIELTPREGYYHVRASEGEACWRVQGHDFHVVLCGLLAEQAPRGVVGSGAGP